MNKHKDDVRVTFHHWLFDNVEIIHDMYKSLFKNRDLYSKTLFYQEFKDQAKDLFITECKIKYSYDCPNNNVCDIIVYTDELFYIMEQLENLEEQKEHFKNL